MFAYMKRKAYLCQQNATSEHILTHQHPMRAKNHITHYALYIIMYICVLPVHAQLNQIEVPNRHACDTSLNDLQKDLWNYYDALVETHPALSDKTPLLDEIEQIAREESLRLQNESAIEELRFSLDRLLVPLHDIHSQIYATEDAVWPPFSIDYLGGEYYIACISKAYSGSAGKVLTGIGNSTMDEITARGKTLVAHENGISLGNEICRRLCTSPLFFGKLGLLNGDSTVTFRFSDSTTATIPLSPDGLPDKVYYSGSVHPITYQSALPFRYSIDTTASVCYMRFNRCFDRRVAMFHSLLSNKPVQNGDAPDFLFFLQDMFADIRKNGIRLLVIDVRNNPGGSECLVTMLARAANIKYDTKRTGGTRISPLAIEAFPGSFSSEKTIDGPDTDCLFALPKDFPYYKGTVVVIEGNITASSGTTIACKAKHKKNKNCVVIGSPFRQNPYLSYGNTFFILLPLTGVEGALPTTVFRRPNPNNETSLQPDVEIPYTIQDIIKGNDPCYDWIIRHKAQLVDNPAQFKTR